MTWQYSNYSEIDSEVERHFPFNNPRKHQLETISEIKKAIDEGYRYIVLEAGTGTGKSAIAATLSSMYESSYILTVTKQLQDQYIKDFTSMKLVKGRSNFKCRKYAKEGIDETCDNGRCVLEGYNCRYSLKNNLGNEITPENTCEYYYQKYLALNAETVISNYHYMFLELNYVGDFSSRRLLICDEAHNLESTIMNQLTLEFSKNDLKEYIKLDITDELLFDLENGDWDVWIQFIEEVKDKFKIELAKIENIPDRPYLKEKISFLRQQITDCSRFISHIAYDPYSWIFDYNDDYDILEFKPLKIDNYAGDTLFKYGDVCIFMSATILDFKLFAKWLGINPDEIYAIRRKSPFDLSRNPIIAYDEFDLSRKFISKNAPDTIGTVKSILKIHENDKGIIHTVSNQCKDFLIDSLKDSRLTDHNTKNRSEQLEKYRNSPDPLVLISPSMNEGVDLPGDLCRFQIMYKIPYPDLGDKQTRLRANRDELWYDFNTALTLVQTYGRGMRFEDDYCRTYFIDRRIKEFVKRDMNSNGFLPESFVEASAISKKSSDDDYIWDDDLINRKREIAQKANRYFEDEDYGNAIRCFSSMIKNELFFGDAYPYYMLSRTYENSQLYEKEVITITRFFKSGISCSDDMLEWFENRLKELADRGYFDYGEIESLKKESLKNRMDMSQIMPPTDRILD